MTRIALRLYRALARAFPHEFKNVYGDELLQTAEDSVEGIRRQDGIAGLARMLLDVALRVPAEYLSELRADVRHGLRILAASPGFTAVALISLSLGICIATCAYTEMNGLMRDLPGVPNPEELVTLQAPVSFPDYRRYRETDLFSTAFAYVAPVPFNTAPGGRAQRTWGQVVTGSYFPALGVRPYIGRFLDAGDDRAGQVAVVVSYRYWKERLGGDRSIVGGTLRINGHPCTIAGVGPENFLGASPALFPADLWLPVSVDARLAPELANRALDRRDLPIFQMGGRLRPGVTEAAAQAGLTAVARQTAKSSGEPERKDLRILLLTGGKVLPLRKQDLPFFREFFMVIGGLVLLIACANVANMMLARAADRRREIALRLALGASRARLIRQLLTESVLVAAGAALPGLLLSVWLMNLASQVRMPLPMPMALDLRADWRALGFAIAVAGITGVLFGLAPALQGTRTGLVSALKEGGGAQRIGYRPLKVRNALVLCQMAASLTLLLITGYLGLGVQSTMGIQQGLDPKNLFLVSLDPVRDGYSGARAAAVLDKILQRVKAVPSIAAACLSDTVPASIDGNPGVRFSHAGATTAERDQFWARRHIVGAGYFETTGIKVVAGRGFDKRDETGGAAPVIVSQTAVRLCWNGENPVGRRIETVNDDASGIFGIWPGTLDYRASVLGKERRTYEVVGVAADVAEDMVADKSRKNPAMYFPLRAGDYESPSLRGLTLIVRGAPGVDAIGAVEREISRVDSSLAPFNARSMAEHISQFMAALKVGSWTYGLIGLFGLVLAAVGLAGTTAYSVARRGHEIGIRMALGAQKRDVLALVMKEGALLVAAGTVAGLLLAWAGIRALSGMFFSVATVQESEPLLLVGAPSVLAALALLACYVPARRSTRIDPAVTLRME